MADKQGKAVLGLWGRMAVASGLFSAVPDAPDDEDPPEQAPEDGTPRPVRSVTPRAQAKRVVTSPDGPINEGVLREVQAAVEQAAAPDLSVVVEIDGELAEDIPDEGRRFKRALSIAEKRGHTPDKIERDLREARQALTGYSQAAELKLAGVQTEEITAKYAAADQKVKDAALLRQQIEDLESEATSLRAEADGAKAALQESGDEIRRAISAVDRDLTRLETTYAAARSIQS